MAADVKMAQMIVLDNNHMGSRPLMDNRITNLMPNSSSNKLLPPHLLILRTHMPHMADIRIMLLSGMLQLPMERNHLARMGPQGLAPRIHGPS